MDTECLGQISSTPFGCRFDSYRRELVDNDDHAQLTERTMQRVSAFMRCSVVIVLFFTHVSRSIFYLLLLFIYYLLIRYLLIYYNLV